MEEHVSLEELCRRLTASDREALGCVFRRLRPDLLRYVTSIVGNQATGHDVVQDVFVSLWELRQTLDPTQSLEAYIYRMARNRAYRHLRDERLHTRKEPEVKDRTAPQLSRPEAPDDRLSANHLGARLWEWVQDLPSRQREALLLSRYHGLSHAEVAAVMDVSPRTVNNHIVRALNRLQDQLRVLESTLLDP